jgi:hypothetical protein
MPTVWRLLAHCMLADCALASFRKGCGVTFFPRVEKNQLALATAGARLSAPTRQTVDRSGWDRIRSQSASPLNFHRVPGARCQATGKPDLCRPGRHNTEQSDTPSRRMTKADSCVLPAGFSTFTESARPSSRTKTLHQSGREAVVRKLVLDFVFFYDLRVHFLSPVRRRQTIMSIRETGIVVGHFLARNDRLIEPPCIGINVSHPDTDVPSKRIKLVGAIDFSKGHRLHATDNAYVDCVTIVHLGVGIECNSLLKLVQIKSDRVPALCARGPSLSGGVPRDCCHSRARARRRGPDLNMPMRSRGLWRWLD